jgi:signal transduction histidine kinase
VRLEIDGRPHVGAIVRDVTAERRLEREADALIRIANTLTTSGTLDERLDAIAEIVVNSTRAVACSVLIISGNPPEVVRLRGHGVSEKMIQSMRDHWHRAVELDAAAYRAFRTGESQVVPDISELTHRRPWGDDYDEPLRSGGWRATIATPVVYRGISLGTLMAYFPREISITPVEIDFLRAIANQASVVIENVRLFQESRARAVLEERQRLARELHDSVSQALYGIALGARTALAMAEQDPQRVREPLDYILSLAEAGLTEMRALIFELRPESLEQEGLIATLRRQLTAFEARYKLEIIAELPEEPVIPLETKEALFRIIQEALLNTVKHAGASRADVRLTFEGNEIIAEIRDNGRGFDTSGTFPGHLGLQSMRERTAASGGNTRIESAPNQGTRIEARIPLSR